MCAGALSLVSGVFGAVQQMQQGKTVESKQMFAARGKILHPRSTEFGTCFWAVKRETVPLSLNLTIDDFYLPAGTFGKVRLVGDGHDGFIILHNHFFK